MRSLYENHLLETGFLKKKKKNENLIKLFEA